MAKKIEMRGCYIPEEIIFHLLLLLPVKSLLRSKAVCKSWRSIISDDQFIETHRKQTPSSSFENAVLVVRRDDRRFIENLYLVNAPTSTKDELVTETRVHLPPQFDGKTCFIDHCNGLVCLSNERGDVIYLWNPSTNQYKVVPRPKKAQDYTAASPTTLGFGFDSISNDYKVLSFWLGPQDGLIITRCVPKAEIYSANADSWVEIEVPATLSSSDNYLYSQRFRTIGGVLYLGRCNDILWLDLHNEAFGVYMFPDSRGTYTLSNILDFRGSVAAILRSAANGCESVYSLWTLLDDGCGKVSWTKKFNLAPDLEFYKTPAFCFLGSGLSVALNGVDECIFYDYFTKKEIKVHLQVAKAVNRQQMSVFAQLTLVVKYTESLVSLKGFAQLEQSGK